MMRTGESMRNGRRRRQRGLLLAGAMSGLALLGASLRDATSAAPPSAEAPTRDESAKRDAPAKTPPADLAKLRAEYDRLRDELFRARVRSQQVEGNIYKSRFDATLVWKGRPDFVLSKARVLLDGAELWDSGDRSEADDRIQVAERPIKPGPHALTIRMEIRPRPSKRAAPRRAAIGSVTPPSTPSPSPSPTTRRPTPPSPPTKTAIRPPTSPSSSSSWRAGHDPTRFLRRVCARAGPGRAGRGVRADGSRRPGRASE